MTRGANSAAAAEVQPVERAQTPWAAPRLFRMGSVAALTSKVDNKGKNDGGRWPRRRT